MRVTTHICALTSKAMRCGITTVSFSFQDTYIQYMLPLTLDKGQKAKVSH